MNMPHTPQFKWEWNLNTMVVIFGFMGGLVAWGYTLADIKTGRIQNAENISNMVSQVAALATRVDAIEKNDFKIVQIEYRIGQNDKVMEGMDLRLNRITESYSNQFADLRTQLSAISTQIALTNQTLNRIEAQPKSATP